MDAEVIAHLQALIRVHQARLHRLERQAARLGPDCPPDITLEIEDGRAIIDELQTKLDRIDHESWVSREPDGWPHLRKIDDPQETFSKQDTDMTTTDKPETTSFITAWLNQRDASLEHDAAEIMELRRTCGYWITMRQWKLDLSNETIQERTDIDTDTIRLLQLGLAKRSLASDDQWCLLAALLVDNEYDYEYVEAVVYLALGDASLIDDELIEVVKQDLGVESPLAIYSSGYDYWLDGSRHYWQAVKEEHERRFQYVLEAFRLYQQAWEEERERQSQEAFRRYLQTLEEERVQRHLTRELEAFFSWRDTDRFIGREQTIKELTVALRQSSNRALLVGVGGVGKTSLLQAFTARNNQLFPGGVVWVDAARRSIEPEYSMFPREHTLQLHDAVQSFLAGQADTAARLRDHLYRSGHGDQGHQALLILDGLEDDVIERWIDVAPSTYRLVISTRSLNRTPQPGTQVIQLKSFSRAESLAFLSGYYWPFSIQDCDNFYTIAEQLGHLPIALRMVGSLLQRYQDTNYLLRVIAHVSQAERIRLLFAQSGLGKTTWDIIKTLLVVYSSLEKGDTVDRLALQILTYLDDESNKNADKLVTMSLLRSLITYTDTITINKSLGRLQEIGIIERYPPERDGVFRLHRSLGSLIDWVNRRWEECSTVIEQLHQEDRAMYQANYPYELANTQPIIDNRFILRGVIAITWRSVIHEGLDLETGLKVIVKEGRSTCNNDKHSLICQHYTQSASILKWLSRRGFQAPRYCSLLHVDDKPYLITTRLDGHTLATMQLHGLLKIQTVARIFLDFCDQVDRLHQAGMVHNNLTLDHVLVQQDGRPALLGWGTAQFIKREKEPHLTVASKHDTYIAQEHLAILQVNDIAALGKILQTLIPRPSPEVAAVIRRAIGHSSDHYTTVAELRRELTAVSVWQKLGIEDDKT